MVNSGSYRDRNEKAALTQQQTNGIRNDPSSPVTAPAPAQCKSDCKGTADVVLPSASAVIEPKMSTENDATAATALTPEDDGGDSSPAGADVDVAVDKSASGGDGATLDKVPGARPPSDGDATDPKFKQNPSRKLICLYCDRTFVSANLRQKHVDRCHSAKQNRRVSPRQMLTATPCVHCDKLNNTEHTLKDLFQHLTTEHSNKYYACTPCEERFLNTIQLTEHNASNHPQTVVTTPETAKLNLTEDPPEEVIPQKVTRSRLKQTESPMQPEKSKVPATGRKNTKFKDLRNKKFAVKSSRIAIKRSTRLQAKVPPEKTKIRRTKQSDRKQKQAEPPATTKAADKTNKSNVPCVNPYPEFDSFFRVKKITDHSIDNLKISSLTFDDVFDKAFFNRIKCNIQENLLHHIDGKLFKNEESESRISNFEKTQQEVQNPSSENYGCELSLNAVTPVAALSLNSQFGEDFESQIEYGSKPSKKKNQTKIKDEVTSYKYVTRRKYQASILEHKENRDLSKLDMWTQLVIKKRQQQIVDDKKSAKEILEYTNGEEYKNKIRKEELNRILDRRGPFEDLREEATKQAALDKLNSNSSESISRETFSEVRQVLNEILNKVYSICDITPKLEPGIASTSTADSEVREIPSYLNLRKTSSLPVDGDVDKSDKIALICSSQETENYELPTNSVREKDELVELTGEWARTRMYLCAACGKKISNMKQLLEHKSVYHQNVWVQHYELVGNQSELYRHLSIPGLGKVGVVEDSVQCKVWKRSDARMCSKCGKQCNSLGELHRHILECGGDWTWMLARKKCKYRPFGAKSRRKRRGLVKRNHHANKTDQPTEKKTYKKTFDGPRQRPSDADTIERMLANLPAKRSTRKIMAIQDGYRRRKNRDPTNPTQNKLKCGKLMYKNVKSNETSNISSPKNIKSIKRNFNSVLSSRLIDTNSTLRAKRILKNLVNRRVTRQTKESPEEGVLAEAEKPLEKETESEQVTPKRKKNNRNKENQDENKDSVETKRVSPRREQSASPQQTKKKINVKKILTGKINIKSFFPVKKKKRVGNADANAENTDTKTRLTRRSKEAKMEEPQASSVETSKAAPVEVNQKNGKKETAKGLVNNFVRTLSMKRKKKSVPSDENLLNIASTAEGTNVPVDTVEDARIPKKRKVKRSFRNVVKKLKKTNEEVTSVPPEPSKSTTQNKPNSFLEENFPLGTSMGRIVAPSILEKNENIVDSTTAVPTAISCIENLLVPETIFNLETSNEKSLQAKGLDSKVPDEGILTKTQCDILDENLTVVDAVNRRNIKHVPEVVVSHDFEKTPNITHIDCMSDKTGPISIETSSKCSNSPLSSPLNSLVSPSSGSLISPSSKKIKKPSRGLNDCIAMLTNKLQQKSDSKVEDAKKVNSEENLASVSKTEMKIAEKPIVPKLFDKPIVQKPECILKIPNFKSPVVEPIEQALDLTKKSDKSLENINQDPVKQDTHKSNESLNSPTNIDSRSPFGLENKSCENLLPPIGYENMFIRQNYSYPNLLALQPNFAFPSGAEMQRFRALSTLMESMAENRVRAYSNMDNIIQQVVENSCNVSISMPNIAKPQEEVLNRNSIDETIEYVVKSSSLRTQLEVLENKIPDIKTHERKIGSIRRRKKKVEETSEPLSEAAQGTGVLNTAFIKQTASESNASDGKRKIGFARKRPNKSNAAKSTKTVESEIPKETNLPSVEGSEFKLQKLYLETNVDDLLSTKEITTKPEVSSSSTIVKSGIIQNSEEHIDMETNELINEDEPHLLENKSVVTLKPEKKNIQSDSEDDIPLAVFAKPVEVPKTDETKVEKAVPVSTEDAITNQTEENEKPVDVPKTFDNETQDFVSNIQADSEKVAISSSVTAQENTIKMTKKATKTKIQRKRGRKSKGKTTNTLVKSEEYDEIDSKNMSVSELESINNSTSDIISSQSKEPSEFINEDLLPSSSCSDENINKAEEIIENINKSDVSDVNKNMRPLQTETEENKIDIQTPRKGRKGRKGKSVKDIIHNFEEINIKSKVEVSVPSDPIDKIDLDGNRTTNENDISQVIPEKTNIIVTSEHCNQKTDLENLGHTDQISETPLESIPVRKTETHIKIQIKRQGKSKTRVSSIILTNDLEPLPEKDVSDIRNNDTKRKVKKKHSNDLQNYEKLNEEIQKEEGNNEPVDTESICKNEESTLGSKNITNNIEQLNNISKCSEEEQDIGKITTENIDSKKINEPKLITKIKRKKSAGLVEEYVANSSITESMNSEAEFNTDLVLEQAGQQGEEGFLESTEKVSGNVPTKTHSKKKKGQKNKSSVKSHDKKLLLDSADIAEKQHVPIETTLSKVIMDEAKLMEKIDKEYSINFTHDNESENFLTKVHLETFDPIKRQHNEFPKVNDKVAGEETPEEITPDPNKVSDCEYLEATKATPKRRKAKKSKTPSKSIPQNDFDASKSCSLKQESNDEIDTSDRSISSDIDSKSNVFDDHQHAISTQLEVLHNTTENVNEELKIQTSLDFQFKSSPKKKKSHRNRSPDKTGHYLIENVNGEQSDIDSVDNAINPDNSHKNVLKMTILNDTNALSEENKSNITKFVEGEQLNGDTPSEIRQNSRNGKNEQHRSTKEELVSENHTDSHPDVLPDKLHLIKSSDNNVEVKNDDFQAEILNPIQKEKDVLPVPKIIVKKRKTNATSPSGLDQIWENANALNNEDADKYFVENSMNFKDQSNHSNILGEGDSKILSKRKRSNKHKEKNIQDVTSEASFSNITEIKTMEKPAKATKRGKSKSPVKKLQTEHVESNNWVDEIIEDNEEFADNITSISGITEAEHVTESDKNDSSPNNINVSNNDYSKNNNEETNNVETVSNTTQNIEKLADKKLQVIQRQIEKVDILPKASEIITTNESPKQQINDKCVQEDNGNLQNVNESCEEELENIQINENSNKKKPRKKKSEVDKLTAAAIILPDLKLSSSDLNVAEDTNRRSRASKTKAAEKISKVTVEEETAYIESLDGDLNLEMSRILESFSKLDKNDLENIGFNIETTKTITDTVTNVDVKVARQKRRKRSKTTDVLNFDVDLSKDDEVGTKKSKVDVKNLECEDVIQNSVATETIGDKSEPVLDESSELKRKPKRKSKVSKKTNKHLSNKLYEDFTLVIKSKRKSRDFVFNMNESNGFEDTLDTTSMENKTSDESEVLKDGNTDRQLKGSPDESFDMVDMELDEIPTDNTIIEREIPLDSLTSTLTQSSDSSSGADLNKDISFGSLTPSSESACSTADIDSEKIKANIVAEAIKRSNRSLNIIEDFNDKTPPSKSEQLFDELIKEQRFDDLLKNKLPDVIQSTPEVNQAVELKEISLNKFMPSKLREADINSTDPSRPKFDFNKYYLEKINQQQKEAQKRKKKVKTFDFSTSDDDDDVNADTGFDDCNSDIYNLSENVSECSQMDSDCKPKNETKVDSVGKKSVNSDVYRFDDEFDDLLTQSSKTTIVKDHIPVEESEPSPLTSTKKKDEIITDLTTDNLVTDHCLNKSDVSIDGGDGLIKSKTKTDKVQKKSQKVLETTDSSTAEMDFQDDKIMNKKKSKQIKHKNLDLLDENQLFGKNVEDTPADENVEVRRSRRCSRKITSYNENELLDPLLDDISQEKRKPRKKDKSPDNKLIDITENITLRPLEIESLSQTNKKGSDKIFDLLKSKSAEIKSPKLHDNFLANIDDTSEELTDAKFDNVFENILEKSMAAIQSQGKNNSQKNNLDKIYEFSESPPTALEESESNNSKFAKKQIRKISIDETIGSESVDLNISSSSISNLTKSSVVTKSLEDAYITDTKPSKKAKPSGNQKEQGPEKENYCEICKKSFIRVENLNKHMRTLTHISKLSELEAKEAEEKARAEQQLNERSKQSDDLDEEIIPPKDDPSTFSLTNSQTLKLANLLSDVINEPALDVQTEQSFGDEVQNSSKIKTEYRRYKSLGERKSFESDNPINSESHTIKSPYYETAPISKQILEKQISLLQNIIENQTGMSYIDDISMSSNNSIIDNTSNRASPSELSIKDDSSNVTFANNGLLTNNTNKSGTNEESFLKPSQYEEISEDSTNVRNYEDQKLRKTLNRDEELFLECCSLLKSGSEVSNYSKKSNKNNLHGHAQMKEANEPNWLESKGISKNQNYNIEYSDDSRMPTPLGDNYDDDASNSNTISSNWNVNVQQKLGYEEVSDDKEDKSFTFEEVLQNNESRDGKSKSGLSRFGGMLSKTITNIKNKIRKPSEDRNASSERKKSDEVTDCSAIDAKKIMTKGAMKVFEGLKVSIPTEELNLEEVLNFSPHGKKSDSTQSDEADVSSAKEVMSPSKRKSKPVKNKSQSSSKLLFKMNKKKTLDKKRKSSSELKTEHDVYDFEDTQDNSEVFSKPDFRTFKTKKDEEPNKEGESENQDVTDDIEQESSSVSSVLVDSNSNQQPKTSKQQQNMTKKKCMIMGRIFKNAVKSKVDEEIRHIPIMDNAEYVENYVEEVNKTKLSQDEAAVELTDQPEETQKTEDKNQTSVNKVKSVENRRKSIKQKSRKRTRANSESTDDEFSLNRSAKKRSYKKNSKPEDNCINLEQELKECIGVASRKSQRKCTSGKQNILVEYWSSDDSAFEAMLETQIIQSKPTKPTVEPAKVEPVLEPPKSETAESTNESANLTNQQLSSTSKVTEKKVQKKPKLPTPKPKIQKTETSTSASNATNATNRRKRASVNPLYHWSSSSEDESSDLIEVKPIRDEADDDDRPIQHGWIVGDSPKKLVTLLAHAKGKKTDIDCVKEQKKRTNSVS